MFAILQNEGDSKIKVLDKKMVDLENKNRALQEEVNEIKATTDLQISLLGDQVSSFRAKFKSQEDAHSLNIEALKGKLDSNEQYERRDALILSGPAVPEVSEREDCKHIVRGLLRDETRLNIDAADISIAHRVGRKPTGRDKRQIIFKLCRRDLVGEIFQACKRTRPPFYINTSLTPLRNKILYGLRQLKRRYPDIVKGCRSTPTGEVNVFIKETGDQSILTGSNGSASSSGSSRERSDEATPGSSSLTNASLMGPQGTTGDTVNESTNGTTSETSDVAVEEASVSTDTVLRRGDRRLIINSKEQLKKFMADHLNSSLESLSISW